MNLTVLSVAFPLTPVSPDAVGGAEQILTLLDDALVEAGHRSLVVACAGSRVRGTLISTPAWDRLLTDEVRAWGQRQHRAAIESTLRRYNVDAVHLHGFDFHQYLPRRDVPSLATLHLPPEWYPDSIFKSPLKHLSMNCVSASQASRCPETSVPLFVVNNGVNIESLSLHAPKRDFALTLGRICPEKGFHHAIDAARAADISLLMAGEVFSYEAHQRYFADEVQPRLDSRRRFIGAAGFRRKRRLLTQARCLLVPSLAPETSSLVAMEALACGTPVIAFPAGALPEIIEEGRTGFLVNDHREMASAIQASRFLDPAECRRAARQRFSSTRMAAEYIVRYREMIGAAAREPQPAGELLQSVR